MDDNRTQDHKNSEGFQELEEIYELINNENYEVAKKQLIKTLKLRKTDENINLNSIALFIDIGYGLRDKDLIQTAIKKGNRLLKEGQFNSHKSVIHSNLANGYMSLWEVNRDYSIDKLVDNQYLKNAKKHYRLTLAHPDNLDNETKLRTLTNYANCLDNLHRNQEALYYYEKALSINPKFSMALGNQAQTMMRYADISGKYQLENYISAYQILSNIIQNKDLLDIGGDNAINSFKRLIDQIESYVDIDLLKNRLEHDKELKYHTDFEKFYLNFCKNNNLFLNFHISTKECKDAYLDSAFISIITPIDDEETYIGLSKKLNDIKGDFLASKLTFAESQYPNNNLESLSEKTTLVNTLDYAIYNINISLLKNSFKNFYSLFDKIAFFINDYFKLELSEKDITFLDVWNLDDKKLKKLLIDLKNPGLFALYDLSLDMGQDYEYLNSIRNTLTHRCITVYDEVLTSVELDTKNHIGYDSFVQKTIHIAQLVKASIIYLLMLVEVEEAKKRRSSKGKIISMELDTKQFFN